MRNKSSNKCQVSINSSFLINGIYDYFIGFMISQIFIFVHKGKYKNTNK